jgi:hypothetical protein
MRLMQLLQRDYPVSPGFLEPKLKLSGARKFYCQANPWGLLRFALLRKYAGLIALLVRAGLLASKTGDRGETNTSNPRIPFEVRNATIVGRGLPESLSSLNA